MFYACEMWIRGVPQLQVICRERLYGCKSHLVCDRWFTITLVTSEFGQVWETRKWVAPLPKIVRNRGAC